MSKELGAFGDLQLTEFWGGRERGVCIQFTPVTSNHYSVLTLAQCRSLRDKLTLVLADQEDGEPGHRTITRIQRDGCLKCDGLGWQFNARTDEESGACAFSVSECSACVTYHAVDAVR